MPENNPVDQAERLKAIRERSRNVIVDAGAGTGKTTLLVSRLLHLIAPEDDGKALPLTRIAAITFTRKAAGELKLRLRERVLSEASRKDLSARRRQRLAHALEALDGAAIGTVHSFADRLLRMQPVAAKLSPAYEIAEDATGLVDETFRALLSEAAIPGEDSEARETLCMFQAAGLLVRSQQTEHADKLGLDAFVRDVIETRDRSVELPNTRAIEWSVIQRRVDELGALVDKLTEDTRGTRRLRSLHKSAKHIVRKDDPGEALRRAVAWSRDARKDELTKRDGFPDDEDGWDAWKWLFEGVRGKNKGKLEREGGPLKAAILEPIFAHMAERLVRLRPAILERYDQVKRERGVVDQIDLLVQLRDLLQRDLGARAFYQARFDHIMVDEFQDTDPLQAEIVMYLCEAGAKAARVGDTVLEAGKLTIVGDPKQSIYRFRRADIAVYAAVCEKIRVGGACEAQLTVNFRSAATILDWLNEGFDEILGSATSGLPYDPETGTVQNVRLAPAIDAHADAGVHVLPFGDAKLKAEESRDLEGEALAHYLRYLVEASDVRITDPRTREPRRPRYGDIAIVMIATQTIHHLTSELDRIGVPHVVRGGTLFMEDPLHQQFILGLRALSDRDDGVARNALLRPPFFAVGLEDLVRAREPEGKSVALQAAELLVTELRRERHKVTPGEFAKRVLERTGFGRYVAASVNGAQRLARVYELCAALDDVARMERLDFDGVTETARGWIDAPPRIEAPLPVDADAVQVITAHQAKGLEWPIVALWDGRAGWKAFLPQVAFAVDADGRWAVKLDGLAHDSTEQELHEREVELRAAERKRVAYVAATRARDVLIVPEAGEPAERYIAGMLLQCGEGKERRRLAAFRGDDGKRAWWKSERKVSLRPLGAMTADLRDAWRGAAERAFAPQWVPVGITTAAEVVRAGEGVPELVREAPAGRHGPVFGSTVHRALQLVLSRRMGVEAATRQAARENACEQIVGVAIEDVSRAYEALRQAGLLEHPLRVEYPVAGALDAGELMSGYVDLLVAAADVWWVIDFKTDAVPRGDVTGAYPQYVAQVRTYARLIERSGGAGPRAIKSALLFTADGGLRLA